MHLNAHSNRFRQLLGQLIEILLVVFLLIVDVGSEAFFHSLLCFLTLILQRVTLHDEVFNIAAESLTEVGKVFFILLASVSNNLFDLVDTLIQQFERRLLLVLL